MSASACSKKGTALRDSLFGSLECVIGSSADSSANGYFFPRPTPPASRSERAQQVKMVAIQAVCNSAVCTMAANAILTNLSPKYKTVNPCTDFEECKDPRTRLPHAKLIPNNWASRMLVMNGECRTRRLVISGGAAEGSSYGEEACGADERVRAGLADSSS